MTTAAMVKIDICVVLYCGVCFVVSSVLYIPSRNNTVNVFYAVNFI